MPVAILAGLFSLPLVDAYQLAVDAQTVPTFASVTEKGKPSGYMLTIQWTIDSTPSYRYDHDLRLSLDVLSVRSAGPLDTLDSAGSDIVLAA